MTPFRLGLTGSIGMGKSATARLFVECGLQVWDADAAVHRLYSRGGAAVEPVARVVPAASRHGAIDRTELKAWISRESGAMAQLESIVHPLVAQDRAAFLRQATSDIVVLDIPLLYEKGYQQEMDAVLLVTAPPDLQRARVLARPGMSEQQFMNILSRQMPDREKRGKADHIIETLGIEAARQAVIALIHYIRSKQHA